MVFPGPIAQLAEPPAHNRMVLGSNPSGPTIVTTQKVPQGMINLVGLSFLIKGYPLLSRLIPWQPLHLRATLGATLTCTGGVAPMPLTDTAIRSAKPQNKTVKMFDGGGLYLELAPAAGGAGSGGD